MKTTTVKELGQKLPIGILDGKSLKKDFTIRPYKVKIDRFLNQWLDANENAMHPAMVAKLMSLLLESVGGSSYQFPENNEANDLLLKLQSEWYMADVLYAYFYSRINTVGSIMEIPYACPNIINKTCTATGIAKVDLLNTEVAVIDDINELEHWVELKKGFKLKDGKICRKLKLQQPRFRVLLSKGSTVVGADSAGYHHLKDMINGVDAVQGSYTLNESEIDEIDKIDSIKIDKESVNAGLKFNTSQDCPKCGVKITNFINWTYDNFFESSVPLVALNN